MRILLLLPFLILGCRSPDPALREPDFYLGCATDETWRSFDDLERAGRVVTSDAEAPRFSVPAAGGTLPSSQPPTFRWEVSAFFPGKENGTASCPDRCGLCGGMTPCVLCGQHEDPVSGDAFDLRFASGVVDRSRVLTTLQAFQPSADLWSSLAGTEVSLTATRIRVEDNDVREGPFRAASPLRFQVTP